MYNEGDVESAINRLGIEGDQRNNEIIATCPMHEHITGKADTNPSWSINIDTGVHHCFSCSYRGTLVGLVADVLEVSWDDAKLWLRQYTTLDLTKTVSLLESYKESYVAPSKVVPMTEARLAVYDVPPKWALDARDLTADACAKYRVKWDSQTNSWITPIRDPYTHALWGWQEKGQGNRYFKNRPPGVLKSQTLFGIDAVEPPYNTVIVVESPLDVVKLSSWGWNGGLATFGALLSQTQLNILRDFRVMFAFDNPSVDSAGMKASQEAMKSARKNGIECSFFNYDHTDKKDIGDMSNEEFVKGYDTARHCSLGIKALG